MERRMEMTSSISEHSCVECKHFKGCTYLQNMSKEHYTGCQYWEPIAPTTGSNIQYNISKSDVQEVKHGKWIKHKSIYTPEGCLYLECSSCNEYFTILGRAFPYCPHCGAKMDGKRKGNGNIY